MVKKRWRISANEMRMDVTDDGKSGKEKRQCCKVSVVATRKLSIQLSNNKMAHQKLDYIHYNPVEAGITKAEEWKYSSAIDYYGGKELIEIIRLDTLIV